MLEVDNWQSALANGFELQSSGTTGVPKHIFQTPAKLLAANRVAVAAQNISAQSRILTVCRMTHAGGLLAQTLPAWSVNAHVEIKPFNAFTFCRDIKGFTHTHLTPMHCRLLLQTKNFSTLDLGGVFVTCGSDSVTFDIIEAFVERGAVFMCNWGMTEIGPVTINTLFDTLDKVKQYREQALAEGTLLGDRYYCEYKIVDDELWVRGDVCVYDDWFNTHDLVALNKQGALYHLGRCQY
ncbi:MAG: class I adenylate-forming enzyme family protein [Gammaproteobacteria bacterium]|jgi:acyl-CoA synthetase (AMP-forming)/AMP-acid ligase II